MIAHNVEKIITHFALVALKFLCSIAIPLPNLPILIQRTFFHKSTSWSKIHSFLRASSFSSCFLRRTLLSIAFFLLKSSFSHQDEIRYLSKYILANFEDLPSIWCVSNQKVNWHAMWICSDTNCNLFVFGIVHYVDWKCRSNIVLLLHNASVWSRSLEHYECLVWSHR